MSISDSSSEKPEQDKRIDNHGTTISQRLDSGTVPQQVYDFYHLHYNNVTFRAVRSALEEAVAIGPLSKTQDNQLFVTDIMGLLIDSSLERCGAMPYQGSEGKLRDLLRPLDSHMTGLALRHLDNFGASPIPEPYAPQMSFHFIELLAVMRSELSSFQHEAQRMKAPKPQLAAAWLNAATMLVGAATDLIADHLSPGTTWRVGARDKLLAAFETLQHGLDLAIDENYALPDELPNTLQQMINSLTHSKDK